jgi:hypothetical protein
MNVLTAASGSSNGYSIPNGGATLPWTVFLSGYPCRPTFFSPHVSRYVFLLLIPRRYLKRPLQVSRPLFFMIFPAVDFSPTGQCFFANR